MPRWLGILLSTLAIAALLALSGWWYLTAPEAVPETSSFAFDLAEIRALAARPKGLRPRRMGSELLGESELPRGAVFAGESFEPHRMAHQAFQVVFPHGFLLIDAGFDEEYLNATMRGGRFHREAYEAVQSAIARAGTIVITHEHGDHIQGLARHDPPGDLAGRLLLTSEQLANSERLDEARVPASLREAVQPLDYDTYHVLAPGVVLIKAAGHTPGSQLVYVALANGREYLIIGDVAWHVEQIRQLHYRPRLVTDFYLAEDRQAVLNQLRALYDLMQAEPELAIVVSHDAEQREQLVRAGLLRSRFEP